MTGAMDLRTVSFDASDAVRLIGQAQREYVDRYGSVDSTPVDPVEFRPPQGIFLIKYVGGMAVAGGGWRAHDGDAEIKRMYVATSARGNGFARELLAELERTATLAGLSQVLLETGTQQPEAIARYESSGYHRIPGFGIYRDEPECVGFAKHLG